MRDEPAIVDAVAREAAAEMIVDAALRDMGERQVHRFERIGESVAKPGAPQKSEELRLGKFRRASDPAIHRIDRLHQAPAEIGEHLFRWRRARRDAVSGLEPVLQDIRVLPDLVGLITIDPRHFIQYTDECWPPVALLLGEIGAAPERLGVRGEEHGERPPALLAELVQRAHIDRVDVGTLLAVDLDVDEQLVHHPRRPLVLEALMRHDVAPMAGGIADREQDGLARRPRLGERRLAPRAPMHGIVFVLEEIGARLLPEAVTWCSLLHGPSFRSALG